MNEHAWFPAAVTIRTELLAELVRSAYAGGALAHSFVECTVLGILQGYDDVDLHIDEPRVIGADGLIHLAVRAWGRLGFSFNSPFESHNDVLITADLGFTAKFQRGALTHPSLQVITDEAHVVTSVRSFDGPFDPEHEAILRDELPGVVARNLTGELAQVPLDRLTNTSPIPGLVNAPGASGTCKIFPEGIVIGISLPERTGNEQELRVFGTHSLAYAVYPDDVALGLGLDERLRAAFQAESPDIGVAFPEITCDTGFFRVSVRLFSDAGHVDLRFSLIPELGEDVLGFVVRDVEHSTTVDHWWEAFLNIFESFGDNEPDFEGLLTQRIASFSVPAVTEFTIPRTTTPMLTARLVRFEIRPDVLLTEVAVTTSLPPAERIDGPTTVRAGVPSTYRLVLPIGHMGDDPRLDLAWSVEHVPVLDNRPEGLTPMPSTTTTTAPAPTPRRRPSIRDTDAQVPLDGDGREVTQPFPGRDLTFTTDFTDGPQANVGLATVHVRATRTFGDMTETAFAASLAVHVS